MVDPVILEICVESVAYAVAAERAGADRVELCVDLACGGVTPGGALMRAAREQVGIPIHALVRPRAGNFCYSDHEIETMHRDIDMAGEIGLNGIVLGVLDSEKKIDRERTRALVQYAHPIPVTFHRAFDQCPNLTAALEAVIETGAKRILTSGGKSCAPDGVVNLEHLVQAAQDRIIIMPGGGIRQRNVERILQTGVREIHTSLKVPNNPESDATRFESTVREFKQMLETLSRVSVPPIDRVKPPVLSNHVVDDHDDAVPGNGLRLFASYEPGTLALHRNKLSNAKRVLDLGCGEQK
ncbi:MAG TPA: copper homeostasis protein CutC [Terriglobales bacterium]|jgi:copper homeostasis protein|nr:copper homeostasis protein CutC [Terriglobales bacterium]